MRVSYNTILSSRNHYYLCLILYCVTHVEIRAKQDNNNVWGLTVSDYNMFRDWSVYNKRRN